MDTSTSQMLQLIEEMRKSGYSQEAEFLEKYAQQFTYRYLPLFEHWDEEHQQWTAYAEDEQDIKPVLDYIEEVLFDGTFNKQHDGSLLDYHEAGKPQRLALKWHISEMEYTAYFWIDDDTIHTIFDHFYGVNPSVKADLIIHIDPKNNKYQLALNCSNPSEPLVFPQETYQLIVFKKKYEHYRSENYDQPNGAWIW